VPGASLAGLPAFLDALCDRGVELVTDLPAECTPIADGRIVADLTDLVAPAA